MALSIKLKSLHIANFKGISDLLIEFNGKNARICGANATGKTTIADAYSWLLFGKDAEGDKDFPVKPKDASGDEIHHLTTMVECEFIRDDGDPEAEEIMLKRTMTEKWTKPRGAIDPVLSGNTEGFFINGADCKKNEFAAYVSKMFGCDDAVFALLTSPTAFNGLDWKVRREMLIRICPVDIDGTLISSMEFADIREDLSAMGGSTDKLLKLYRDNRKAMQKEIDAIPARIDEIRRGTEIVKDEDVLEALSDAEECRKAISALDDRIAGAMSAGKDKALYDAVEAARKERDRTHLEFIKRNAEIEEKRRNVRAKIDAHKAALGDARFRAESARAEAEAIDGLVEQIRAEWKAAAAEHCEVDVDTVCPTCGQAMPEDAIDRIRETRLSELMKRRAVRLDDMKARANRHKADAQKARERMTAMERTVDECTSKIAELEEQLASIEDASDAAYLAACDRLMTAEETLDNASEGNDEQLIESLKQEREDLRQRMAKDDRIVNSVEASRAAQKRIDDLNAELASKRSEIARTEVMTMTVEEFVRKRSEALEEAVNGSFPTVRFRLTKQNLNGGVDDCCTCFVRNAETGSLVPWDKANGAGKINAGLEIVNTLSAYYGIRVPIVIDNAESVNVLASTEGQQIALTVTDDAPMIVNIEN